MLKINKITANSVIDFAAEELKKYLRMMMPEGGDIRIAYDPEACDGFRLGLMQDFGIDVSDAEDTELDDILYIDCNTEGGIIAGDNPRSVLLSVYEYLRQNGCRWLYPGIDGEYIPMKDIIPIKYRHKPSCRYRGQCNEGAESQQCMMETIDFTPKVGMNVYMLEFRIPTFYYDCYYDHNHNKENREPEPVADGQILQWKRQCEAEIAKRGLQFHDIGHGWTVDAFGIDSSATWCKIDESAISEDAKQYLPLIGEKRGLFNSQPINTQFCMSNAKARRRVANYVADYAEAHSNSDYLHVWLADARNNHCECEACVKKSASDWYVVLLNEIDEELARRELKNRIVFIAYFDTMWAPESEVIKNPERFTLLIAPITRSYTSSLPSGKINAKANKYIRNNNIYPKNLEEYFAHFLEWKKKWHGSNVSYEYHFWVHQCYDVSGIALSKRINDDVKAYKAFDVNGIIEDGSQRSFFPNGLAFYTYARTLFDCALSFEEICEDYLYHVYGEDWSEFYEYLCALGEAIPRDLLTVGLELMIPGDEKEKYEKIINPDYTERLRKVEAIVANGRELIKSHYSSPIRVQTVSVRLLERHAEFCELISSALIERTQNNLSEALHLFNKARTEFGKYEVEIERYFDHFLYFDSLRTLFDAPAEKDGQTV